MSRSTIASGRLGSRTESKACPSLHHRQLRLRRARPVQLITERRQRRPDPRPGRNHVKKTRREWRSGASQVVYQRGIELFTAVDQDRAVSVVFGGDEPITRKGSAPRSAVGFIRTTRARRRRCRRRRRSCSRNRETYRPQEKQTVDLSRCRRTKRGRQSSKWFACVSSRFLLDRFMSSAAAER